MSQNNQPPGSMYPQLGTAFNQPQSYEPAAQSTGYNIYSLPQPSAPSAPSFSHPTQLYDMPHATHPPAAPAIPTYAMYTAPTQTITPIPIYQPNAAAPPATSTQATPANFYSPQTAFIPSDPSAIPTNTPIKIKARSGGYLHAVHVTAGSAVVLWSEAQTDNQRWIYTPEGFLENCGDRNLVIDCKTGSQGEVLLLWYKRHTVDNLNQKWVVTISGAERCIASALNGLILDGKGGLTALGTEVVVWPRRGTTNNGSQLWSIQTLGGGFLAAVGLNTSGSVKQIVPYGTPAFIKSAATGYILDIQWNKRVSGTPIHMWDENYITSSAHQQWFFTPEGFIESKADRKLVIDCKSGNYGDELSVATKKHDHAPDSIFQKFIIMAIPNTPYKYIACSMNPEMVLTVHNGSKNKGARVMLAHNLGANNNHQRWFFKTVN